MEHKRQIDYIVINCRFSNCARKEYVAHGWGANLEQQRLHAALRMGICLHFTKHYYQEIWHATGIGIHYNIKQARMQPELLTRHISERKIFFTYDSGNDHSQNWEHTKSTLQQALRQVYPVTKSNNATKTWGRKGYEHATLQEKRRREQLVQERGKIQKQINLLGKQSAEMKKQHITHDP